MSYKGVEQSKHFFVYSTAFISFSGDSITSATFNAYKKVLTLVPINSTLFDDMSSTNVQRSVHCCNLMLNKQSEKPQRSAFFYRSFKMLHMRCATSKKRTLETLLETSHRLELMKDIDTWIRYSSFC